MVAERYYLSRFGSRWVECLSGTDEMKREFETAHPRYSTLADCETLSLIHTHNTHARTHTRTHTHTHTVHKIPLEVLNPVQLSETSQLKNSLLCIHPPLCVLLVVGCCCCWLLLLLLCVFPELAGPAVVISCPDHPEARQLSKRLPGYLTVQKLKGLLQRVYRVDTGQQRLSYLDSTVRVCVCVCVRLFSLSPSLPPSLPPSLSPSLSLSLSLSLEKHRDRDGR